MSGPVPDDVPCARPGGELTPLRGAGGGLPAVPAWCRESPDDEQSPRAGGSWHLGGETRLVDGVTMREGTFPVVRRSTVRRESQCVIHLNTLTDNHRTHIAPARQAGAGWALHVLLPDDALGLSDRGDVRSVARRRRGDGSAEPHIEGRPDALPRSTHDGFGFVLLWRGRAVTHPEWSVAPAEGATAAPSIDRQRREGTDSVEVGGGPLTA